MAGNARAVKVLAKLNESLHVRDCLKMRNKIRSSRLSQVTNKLLHMILRLVASVVVQDGLQIILAGVRVPPAKPHNLRFPILEFLQTFSFRLLVCWKISFLFIFRCRLS